MVQKILAVTMGLLLNALIVFLMESLGHFIYPLPSELNTFSEVSEERIIELRAGLKTGYYLFVLGGWSFGPFLGAALASKILPEYWEKSSFNIGVIVAILVLWITSQMPHPTWLVVLGLVLPVPMAYLGGKIFGGK